MARWFGCDLPCVADRANGAQAALRAAAGTALVLTALVAPAAPVNDPEPGSRDVRGWLMRIHAAASRRNFQGTFVVSAGGAVSSARIAHYAVGANQYERSETLDGEMRRVYRLNDVVVTLWPVQHIATVEQRDLIAQFPALLQAGDDGIGDRYQLQPQPAERLAGRDADVLVVQPRDALRYGYRLWADRASGLLLRLDTLGARQEVLESSAFSDLAVDVRAEPQSVVLPMKKLDGWQVIHPVMEATRLEAHGWSMREPVPGFRAVSCVRRPMADAGGANSEAAPQAIQAIFSDGLTYVSVFIEPYDPARPKMPMQTAVGATQTLMQPRGDAWLTLVGDVPPATLRLFAQGLERRK